MAKMEPGTSSPEVKELQKQINTLLGRGSVKETGTFDEVTQAKVAELQKKLKFGYTSGVPDKKTLDAIDDAMIPRAPLRINNKVYWVTSEEYYKVMTAISNKSVEAVRPYLSMAESFISLWEANDRARKDNKLFSTIVDGVTGANFPSAQTAAKVRAAAKTILTGAQTLTLTPAALAKEDAVIRQAFADMDQYRDEIHVGGEKLVVYLQGLKEACVITLKIAIAVKTAPMSFAAQVGGGAAGGAYEALLNEIEGASTKSSVDFGDAAFNIVKASTIDAVVTAVMKGNAKSMEKIVEKCCRLAAEKAVAKVGQEAVMKYLEKAIATSAKNVIETALKAMLEFKFMDKQLKEGEVKDKIIETMLAGLGAGALGKYVDARTGDKILSSIKVKDVAKALGVTDVPKQLEEAITSGIKEAGPAIVLGLVSALSNPAEAKNEGALDKKAIAGIAKNGKIQAALKTAKKK